MVACLAPFSVAQSPELPRPVLLTVQPITFLPVEWTPRPATPPAEEADRLEKTRRGPAPAGLLELLDSLGVVPPVAPVRADVNRKLGEVLDRAEFVRSLFATGRFKAEIRLNEEGRYELALSFEKSATWKELAWVYVYGLRQWFEHLNTEAGKKQVAQMYLQAAHQALDAGHTDKAADLVRQAHAWKPALVEADPMAFKLHLLERGKTGPSGEEAAEPSRRLPIHPRQYSSAVMRLRAWGSEVMQSERMQTARMVMRTSLDGSRIPMSAPTDFENGIAWMGFTVTGRPTFTLMVRCHETGGNWMVHVGNGTIPVVWMMPQR
jgi:hypothetical protein